MRPERLAGAWRAAANWREQLSNGRGPHALGHAEQRAPSIVGRVARVEKWQEKMPPSGVAEARLLLPRVAREVGAEERVLGGVVKAAAGLACGRQHRCRHPGRAARSGNAPQEKGLLLFYNSCLLRTR